eukprot:14259845-Alexandrium_andersonii.AAC.1
MCNPAICAIRSPEWQGLEKHALALAWADRPLFRAPSQTWRRPGARSRNLRNLLARAGRSRDRRVRGVPSRESLV